MKAWMRGLLAAGAAAVAAAGTVTALSVTPAAAASLVQVSNFGANPTNLQMYIYVPNNVRPDPPILVALHQCTGSGPGFYSSTAFASLADQYGFIVIYPSATRSGSCWDVSSSAALTRGGGSDPEGIMSMVTYAEQNYGGNPNQVYVTGASSGAMMTNVLLADYPDVFKAGAAFMGVPYYCFYTGTVDGWNSSCADGDVSMTAQAWGNLARNADPGYGGPRPRMQLWHGTADTTLNYENLSQEILQWTNVLGVSSTPVSTTTPESSWTETQYGSTSNPQVEAFSIAGAGHVLPIEGDGMEADAIQFFGLSNSSPPPSSPPPSSPPPSSPPPGGGSCSVTYTTQSQWAGGFVGQVVIGDTGSSAISSWTLTFTFPGDQQITSDFNGTASQSGENATLTSASYNGAISPGGSVTAGFQGTWTSNDTAPTSFTLNGATCT
jgi:poly(hydroxyalkanoate) depolymerase family esterase